VQDVVPIFFKGFFGSLADKYGKKPIFVISIAIRTVVGLLYAVAGASAVMFAIKLLQGLSDSAKGPSASAMIADSTDERNIAQAYSWYSTIKSTSGGLGESIAFAVLPFILVYFVGGAAVTVNVAKLDAVDKKTGQQVERIVGPNEIDAENTVGDEKDSTKRIAVVGQEQRETSLRSVPFNDLPKVVELVSLKKALALMLVVAAAFSFVSLLLIQFFIKEPKREKKDKSKDKSKDKKKDIPKGATGLLHLPQKQPNVWAFAALGAIMTAPAYMLTGTFFTLLAVQLGVLPAAFFWIKLLSETVIPLLFGPIFGILADRIGAGKVIALRSIANIFSSALIIATQFLSGAFLLSLLVGLARALDEMGKAAFKPTWGAVMAKVSSYDLANRARSMGIMEGGSDTASMAIPQVSGLINEGLKKLAIAPILPLMILRIVVALIAEVFGHIMMKKYKI
jgi:MFS family permease